MPATTPETTRETAPETTPETTDVAIIGGGAAGCAVALYLAEAGLSATIIERDAVGSQASGYAAGGLSPLTGHGIPGPLADFAWASFELHHGLYPMLNELTGIDYQLRRTSEIRLTFDESEVPHFEALAERLMLHPRFAASMTEQWIVREKLDRRVNSIFAGCVFTRGNYALDSLGFTQALAAAAQRSGAKIRPGAVRGLTIRGDQVTQVLLDDGEIHCGEVVLAMGPWSRQAERWLEAYIPVDPLKGEILRMKLPGPPLEHDVVGAGASVYPKPDGLVWCGTTEDWRGYDRQPLTETRERIIAGVRRLVPSITEATLVTHTACLRPVTPDWLPLLGRVPQYRNAWLATGAGKKGILLAPAIGKAIADLIATDHTDLPIQNFAPQRFAAPTG